MFHSGRGRLGALLAGGIAVCVLVAPLAAAACTRVVYLGPNGYVITARSMDWNTDIGTHLWIFPRGLRRSGEAGANSLRWTAKFGSVIASAYDVSTADGLNEAGLAANLLWLVESQYPSYNGRRPGLSVAAWAQYVLDSFGTVAEAVDALRREPFLLVTDTVPGEQRLATVHLSLSDATGDSAIIEYVGGKQVIHHERKYQVMTNSPVFDEQLALNEYWKHVGGTAMLPGTNRSADRFARASYYVHAIPKTEDPTIALASVFSVIRNVSVPYGISTPDQPNISSTRWRTVVDHKQGLYFFESALTPSTFWVDLKQINFSAETGRVKRLDLGKNQANTFSGDTSRSFQEATPFQFQTAASRPVAASRPARSEPARSEPARSEQDQGPERAKPDASVGGEQPQSAEQLKPDASGWSGKPQSPERHKPDASAASSADAGT